MTRFARIVCSAAAAAAALAAAPAAQAEPAAAITGQDRLVTFDTASPDALTVRQLSGLKSPNNESVIGLDVRPTTGQLYAVTVPLGVAGSALIRTYTIDPKTATATFVGSLQSIGSTWGDRPTGLDINPVADVIRVVQSNGANFRIKPSDGSLIASDNNLSFAPAATGPVSGAAYDRNVPASNATTLYEVDAGADRLVKQGGTDGAPSANGGAVTDVGALGVSVDDSTDAGFDISPSGTAYASLTSSGRPGLYTVDLTTGTATLVAKTPLELRSLAVLAPEVKTPAPQPDLAAPVVKVSGAPKRISYAKFAKGLKLRLTANEPAAAELSLFGRARTVGLAKVGDLTLAQRTVALWTGKGSLTLEPRRKLLAKQRRFTVRLEITATDAAKNRRTITRTIRVG